MKQIGSEIVVDFRITTKQLQNYKFRQLPKQRNEIRNTSPCYKWHVFQNGNWNCMDGYKRQLGYKITEWCYTANLW